MAQAAKALGIPFNTFKRKAKRLGIYKTNQSGKGLKKNSQPPSTRPFEDILVEHSTYSSTHNLKRRLIRAGLLEEKCVWCGLTDTWNGKMLVLQLDHINGISNDHRLENLRLLCPNCHSQTETYCARNLKRADVAE